MPLQNLAEGSNLWCAAFGRHYSTHLDATELAAMTRAFQQRHLLAHTQDLVDQDYIARSGDTAYRPGQHRRRRPRRCHCVIAGEELVDPNRAFRMSTPVWSGLGQAAISAAFDPLRSGRTALS